MRADNFDPEDIVQYLQGTCTGTIESALQEICNDDFSIKYPEMTEDDLIESDYYYIDNFIFYCHSCGWWCETSEDNDYNGEQYCDDCYAAETENNE